MYSTYVVRTVVGRGPAVLERNQRQRPNIDKQLDDSALFIRKTDVYE